ncbi:CPBP family intramembrane glutamic endopeptidase [Micropruina sp.]|uniref:CPBP family intramembrane glutamic endopeptidase n=1 Tax=Micropruina sp. TaxID=2737536 RepID=UPI0039E47955
MPVFGELRAFVRASLLDPADEPSTASRRRWIVTGVTLIAGAVTLGWSLSIRPGDPLFYPATIGVAVVWLVGAFASGPLRLGHGRTRTGGTSRALLQGVILGGLLLAVFLAGALLVGRLPWLRGPVDVLLAHAGYGALPIVAAITALNGVAEELFFRGAVFAALTRWRVAVSTAVYAVATMPSGVPLLVFAAVALGVVTGLQRRATGGVSGPIATHLTWSLGMLFALPWALNVGS